MTHARSSYTAGAGIAIGVVLVALSVGTPAAAADRGVDAAESVASQSTTTNGGCVAAVTAAIATGDTSTPLQACSSTVSLSASPAQAVTSADLAREQANMSPEAFADVSASAFANLVTRRTFSQTFSNDYALGCAVEEKDCSESGSLSQRDLYMRWHISVIASGGQVNWDESHTVHVNAAGRIWQ